MRVLAKVIVGVALFVCSLAVGSQQDRSPAAIPPQWAYGFKTPLGSPAGSEPVSIQTSELAKDNGDLIHLPDSALGFTLTQIRSGAADWYPNDHPMMPDIVAYGRKPQIMPCIVCHYTNGKGDPANASIASLPYEYFVHTMEDFRTGSRQSADPRKYNTRNMIAYAKAMTDDEIKGSAKYFCAIPFISRIKVIESNTVPKTRLVAAGVYFPMEGNETEPLEDRLIEMPESANAFIYKNPRSKAVAYVPVGSIKRGERLVMTGGDGKTAQCATCHGADLQGLGPVPGIAGRGPSYVIRQLFDIQQGYRHGTWSELMTPVVYKLTVDDMIDIAAYLSSRSIGTAQ